MASAHTLPLAVDRGLRAGFFREDDPGASGTIPLQLKGSAICEVVTAAAESRALPTPGGYATGHRLMVVLKTDGGDLTITGADQSVILRDAGDVVEFVIVDNNGTKAWRVLSDSRVQSGLFGSKTVDMPIGNNWRNSDDIDLNLANADAAGDLGLVTGTFGTSAPSLNVTVVTPSAAEFRARDPHFVVPSDYKAGTNLTVDVAVTETVAATTANLDVQVVRRNAPSVDIVSTAPLSAIGGGTFSFTLTGTNVVPGEVLDIEVGLTLTDAVATPNYSITKVNVDYQAG